MPEQGTVSGGARHVLDPTLLLHTFYIPWESAAPWKHSGCSRKWRKGVVSKTTHPLFFLSFFFSSFFFWFVFRRCVQQLWFALHPFFFFFFFFFFVFLLHGFKAWVGMIEEICVERITQVMVRVRWLFEPNDELVLRADLTERSMKYHSSHPLGPRGIEVRTSCPTKHKKKETQLKHFARTRKCISLFSASVCRQTCSLLHIT